MRTEPTTFAGRDQVNPRAGREAAAALWAEAGITDPMSEVDVAEIYVPFSWFEPMWLENLGFAPEGEGWKVTEKGETAIGGRLPCNPSGGVLSSNPIGASGLLRFAESAMQVMGRAGEHQVEGARTALGHAYGGGSQFFSMYKIESGSAIESNPTASAVLASSVSWSTGLIATLTVYCMRVTACPPRRPTSSSIVRHRRTRGPAPCGHPRPGDHRPSP